MSPWSIHRASFTSETLLAGLWEKFSPDGTGAVVVVAVAADPSVAAVHDRMPAIVGLKAARTWLAGTAEEAMMVVGPVAGMANLV